MLLSDAGHCKHNSLYKYKCAWIREDDDKCTKGHFNCTLNIWTRKDLEWLSGSTSNHLSSNRSLQYVPPIYQLDMYWYAPCLNKNKWGFTSHGFIEMKIVVLLLIILKNIMESRPILMFLLKGSWLIFLCPLTTAVYRSTRLFLVLVA